MQSINARKKQKSPQTVPLYTGKSLSENLIFLLREYKITLYQLYKNTNVPLTTLKRMKNDTNTNPTVASLLPIAKFFSLSLNQLIGLDPLPSEFQLGVYTEKRNYWTLLPIISWEDVVTWPTNRINHAKQPTVSTDLELDKNAFALLLIEDNWDGFQKGSTLIFDPNKSPRHKDYLLIYKSNTPQAFLYQLLINSDEYYLKPPCPDFGIRKLRDDDAIKGILVQIRMDVRNENSNCN